MARLVAILKIADM